MMRRLLLLWLGVVSLCVAQEPLARVSIADDGDHWVGQRLTLVVELLVPGYFSGAPAFDLPGVPGLLLVPPSGSPLVSSETLGEVSYTVQRHEIGVFARRAGGTTIPPFPVRLQFKRHPLDQDAQTAVVQTEAVQITVKAPPGTEGLGNLISARNLQATEAWKPEPGPAKAGDAFTRTITFSAPDIPAMAFPIFPTPPIDGLGVYPKAPEVLDQSERGELRGERRDAIVYVCRRAGQFTIPAVRLSWWDLEAKKLQVVEFPARTLNVAPSAVPASKALAASSSSTTWRPIGMALAAVLMLQAAALLVWKTRLCWLRIFKPFRPVHLASLNPHSGKFSAHP